MKLSFHFMFWVGLWFILFLVSPLLLSTNGQVLRINKEIDSVSSVFGESKTNELVATASSIYVALFVDTKILTEDNKLYTKDLVVPTDEERILARASKPLSQTTNAYFRALSVNVYGLIIRWQIIMHWLLFILPFLIAAFCDGFVSRKLKFIQFGYISPMAYSLSLHFIVFLLFIPLLYLVAPLPITPYFMPGWAIVTGFPIMLLVANTQRLLNG